MKQSSFSYKSASFMRYLFLTLTALMVLALYILAPLGLPKMADVSPREVTRHVVVSQTVEKESFQDEVVSGSFKEEDGIAVGTCSELASIFGRCQYKLARNERNSYQIPRVYLSSLPKDFSRVSYGAKKDLFLKSLLPLILEANEKILIERKKILSIRAQKQSGMKLSPHQERWLTQIATKYRLKTPCLNELSLRVDVIPPSLALSQAITESGWGTSQAARTKNSTFGMMSSDQVMRYESLRESVESYMRNINSHGAYKSLRQIRAGLRDKEASLCGVQLANGLKAYSVRGMGYVREIQTVIQNNNLKQFDSAQLVRDL